MNAISARVVAVGLLVLAAPALAQVPVIPSKVKDPKDFQLVDIGRVKSWKPGGARILYLKDEQDQWFRVDIVEPCMDLFPGKTPTFVTLTDTAGTRYSGVVIERRQCDVSKITKMTEQPPREPYVPPPQAAAKPAAAPATPAPQPAKK